MDHYTTEERANYNREYHEKRKQEYLSYLGGQCALCDAVDDLEFDHIDWRSKSFGIMSKWTAADQDLVYAELDKCQLLCQAHHKLKTKQDFAEQSYYRPISHGTMYAWMKLKCQCSVCYTAKREWHDKRNAARRAS